MNPVRTPRLPALSVVIPTRNTRELTLACLQSLHDHAVPGIEVVVVDDAGTDDTPEAVSRAFPSVRVLRSPEASGFTVTANRGMAAASGEVILLLNSDTEVLERSLDALLAAFEDGRMGVAGALLSYPDGSDQWSGGSEPGLLWLFVQASGLGPLLGRLPLRRRPSRRAGGSAAPRTVDWVTGAALAVSRRALDQVGPLDERFVFYAQDLDFCLRVRDAGWAVRIVPRCRIVHHHGYSISGTRATVRSQQLELLWRDLLFWAEKQHGADWQRRARRALAYGAGLRVLGRTLATPVMLPLAGSGWRQSTAACRRALRALRG